MANETPPPIPGSAPAKKGLSPVAWIAIGCGGLLVLCCIVFLVLGVLAFYKGREMVVEATGAESFKEFVEDFENDPAKTAAEMIVRANPELELISSNDDGTITFENTRTGEQATLDFQDIAEGRFSMTTDGGEYSIDAADGGEGGVTFKGPEGETRFGGSADLSDVPDWVPLYPGAEEVQSSFHNTSAAGVSGAVSGKTQDHAQEVLDHFKKTLEDQGYTIGSQSMTSTPGGAYAGISGKLDDARSVNVGIIEQQGETVITINYNMKKE